MNLVLSNFVMRHEIIFKLMEYNRFFAKQQLNDQLYDQITDLLFILKKNQKQTDSNELKILPHVNEADTSKFTKINYDYEMYIQLIKTEQNYLVQKLIEILNDQKSCKNVHQLIQLQKNFLYNLIKVLTETINQKKRISHAMYIAENIKENTQFFKYFTTTFFYSFQKNFGYYQQNGFEYERSHGCYSILNNVIHKQQLPIINHFHDQMKKIQQRNLPIQNSLTIYNNKHQKFQDNIEKNQNFQESKEKNQKMNESRTQKLQKSQHLRSDEPIKTKQSIDVTHKEEYLGQKKVQNLKEFRNTIHQIFQPQQQQQVMKMKIFDLSLTHSKKSMHVGKSYDNQNNLTNQYIPLNQSGQINQPNQVSLIKPIKSKSKLQTSNNYLIEKSYSIDKQFEKSFEKSLMGKRRNFESFSLCQKEFNNKFLQTKQVNYPAVKQYIRPSNLKINPHKNEKSTEESVQSKPYSYFISDIINQQIENTYLQKLQARKNLSIHKSTNQNLTVYRYPHLKKPNLSFTVVKNAQ